MECSYCKSTFPTRNALERHKKRATACISWNQLDELVESYEKRTASLRNSLERALEIIKLKSKTYEDIIEDRDAQIRELTAALLITEEGAWENIHVVAPFLSAKTKKCIKKATKHLKTLESVSDYIKMSYRDHNISVTKQNMDLVITIEDRELSECKVCFADNSKRKGRCKACKTCQTCEACEKTRNR